MSEEILLRYGLYKDYLYKGESDHKLICRLDIEPSMTYRSDYKSVFCDICLVLDGSSSMDDPFTDGFSITKRQGVITAAKSMIPHLNDQDTVSIVFYDSRAYNIGAGIPGIESNDVQNRLDMLGQYSGSTNFEAALKMAKSVLEKGKNPSRRIIFLTDGQANDGDAMEVKRIVQDLNREGVAIDSLGVGSDFNFHYMRSLSGPSNGRTFLLGTPEEASRRFEEVLTGAQKVVADHVFLTVLFPKGLRDIEVYQWLPEMRYYGDIELQQDGHTRLEINIQTLRQDRRNIFFFKARIDPPEKGDTLLFANVRLDFDLLPLRKSGLQETLNIYINFTHKPNNEEYDTTVEDGFLEVELAKLYERFEEFRDGDWQKALAVLEEMIRRANGLGDRQRVDEYNRYKEKLKNDHKLSDDDFNRVGNISSQSTQAEEGYLEDSDELDILKNL